MFRRLIEQHFAWLSRIHDRNIDAVQRLGQVHDRSTDLIRQLATLQSSLDALKKSMCGSEIREILRDLRYSDARRLEHFGFKVFSQNGEDGILWEIFRRIGCTNKRFVEFGVYDGVECNTHLLLYLGWSGLWIEKLPDAVDRIRDVFSRPIQDGRLRLTPEETSPGNINIIIGGTGFTGEIDLLSVDIDGNDYHVCDAINVVRPRVIVAEYNATFPPPIEWVQPYRSAYRPDGSMYFGASLAAYARLLAMKGFQLVGTDITGVNAFFVRRDLLDDHFCEVGQVEALYNPPRYWLSAGFPTGHPTSFSSFDYGVPRP